MDEISKQSLDLHYALQGKIEIVARRHVETREDLSLLYTPGVAQPCREIQADYNKSFELTRRNNLVAVITDGTAVLGLGDIGPAAGMPVMEGKCALFKEFGGVDAFPICVDTKDTDQLVETIYLISKSFGGINLEDIAAPRCFEVERRLKELCDIPVFHDDQHGTAIVVAAALINAVKVTGKEMGKLKIVINGAGAAGCAIGNLLISMGFGNVVMCDINGIICEGDQGLNAGQEAISHISNRNHEHGALADALKGADAFVGVSRPGLVTAEMVSTMNRGIVFPMANPVPEIMPDEALRGGAAVVGTGRSDFPNQINNVLVFPGIFKGALSVRATDITEGMKVRAAKALAALVPEDQLSPACIIPSVLDKSVAEAVAKAVADEAREQGIARVPSGGAEE
jgi:malate dehydrogenase (oxaloacetate-decarboxylating)